MYTVYGIYLKGSDEALYIGSTQLPLAFRFSSHLHAKAPPRKRGTHPATEARERMMADHRAGRVTLEIRPITGFGDRKEAQRREFEEIAKQRPPLNIYNGTRKTECVGTRRSQENYAAKSSEEMKAVLRYMRTCERDGIKPTQSMLDLYRKHFPQAA